MVSGEDVQLPDLQVIQRYSLAVRGATAPIADVIAVLQSDLAWLTGSGRRRSTEPAKKAAPAKTGAVATKKVTPAKKAGAAAKKTAKRTGARRA